MLCFWSASEQEDLEPEVISQEDGEVYFKPRRKMDPCEQGAQDWSQLEQMIDHTYTHPCGPPELPRQKPTTLRVHIDENGDNSLSKFASNSLSSDVERTQSFRQRSTSNLMRVIYLHGSSWLVKKAWRLVEHIVDRLVQQWPQLVLSIKYLLASVTYLDSNNLMQRYRLTLRNRSVHCRGYFCRL